MPAFKCLYLLENDELYILEISRTDLEDGAPASEKFRWLKIEKATMQVADLTFRSIDAAGEIEERYFEEGFLKFNGTTGTLIEKFNSAQHPLVRKQGDTLTADLANAIATHLHVTA